MVFILNFIILFYFIYLFYFIILLLLLFKGRQNFTPSEILDLELRFCTRRHLIREIVFKIS